MPIASQRANRIHVIEGRPRVRYMHDITPKMGIHGTHGHLKGLSRSGSLRRNTIMPMQMRMKANKVPMLVRSTISSIDANAENPATTTPVIIVVTCGVLKRLWTLAQNGGSSPSRDIHEKNRFANKTVLISIFRHPLIKKAK